MIFIYKLLKENKIIYIGQTKYVKNRYNDHKNKNFDNFEIIDKAENKKEANNLEDLYIKMYDPILNKKLNIGGTYINIDDLIKKWNVENKELFLNKIKEKGIIPIFNNNYQSNKITNFLIKLRLEGIV